MLFSLKRQVLAIFAFVLAALSPAAFAQATGAAATFGTTMTGMTSDVTTYGGQLVVLAAVGVAFMVGIKYIKKIRGAA